MSGGQPAPATLQPGEKLWRMIEEDWYQPDYTGRYVVHEIAFIGNVSFARADYVTQTDADSVPDRSGNPKFVKHGIAALDADTIRSKTGGDLVVTADPYGWPLNTHVEFRRKSGGKTLTGTHPEVIDLTDLANATALIRPPKP